jgi:hypothetical protein
MVFLKQLLQLLHVFIFCLNCFHFNTHKKKILKKWFRILHSNIAQILKSLARMHQKTSKINAQKDKELNLKINFVEHVYGPISGMHFYHAVAFRDFLNIHHKKFDLRSTKTNFIVRVWEIATKKHTLNLLIDPYSSCKKFFTWIRNVGSTLQLPQMLHQIHESLTNLGRHWLIFTKFSSWFRRKWGPNI